MVSLSSKFDVPRSMKIVLLILLFTEIMCELSRSTDFPLCTIIVSFVAYPHELATVVRVSEYCLTCSRMTKSYVTVALFCVGHRYDCIGASGVFI
jgi:hypothetical protein